MNPRNRIYLPAPLNRQHPLTRGLVAFYLALPHQAAGSTWFDLCGVSHLTLASLSTGDGFQPSARPGGFGAAVKLDGTATCKRTVSVPITGLPCTLACWYSPAVGASNYGLMSVDDGTASNQIGMEQFSSKVGAFLDFGVGEVFDTATIAGSNTWNFAAATFVPGTQYAYLNGANKSAAGTSAFAPSGLNTIRIGSNTFATKLSGSIDCALIYNRALADAEVLALYLETKLGCPRLLRWRNRAALGYPVGNKFKPEQLAFSPLTGMY